MFHNNKNVDVTDLQNLCVQNYKTCFKTKISQLHLKQQIISKVDLFDILKFCFEFIFQGRIVLTKIVCGLHPGLFAVLFDHNISDTARFTDSHLPGFNEKGGINLNNIA